MICCRRWLNHCAVGRGFPQGWDLFAAQMDGTHQAMITSCRLLYISTALPSPALKLMRVLSRSMTMAAILTCSRSQVASINARGNCLQQWQYSNLTPEFRKSGSTTPIDLAAPNT